MLFYSLFPDEKLCIFSVAGKLTIEEMQQRLDELAAEADWPTVHTIVTDLRGCWDVDAGFMEADQRQAMEIRSFGNRRMIWLTGSSSVLGKMAMAANEGLSAGVDPRIFRDKTEMARCLGPSGAGIMHCLESME